MVALAVTSGCRVPHLGGASDFMLVERARIAVAPPSAARGYNAWPVSCRLANGDILVAYTSTTGHHTSNDAAAVFKRSTDNGATWGSEVTIYDDASLFVTVYGLGQASSGRLFATMWKDDYATPGTGRALIAYSDDNGATWSAPTDVTSAAGFTAEGFGAGPVVECPDGSIIFTVEGYNSGQSFSTDERSVILRSTNNGASWGSPVTVASGTRPYYEGKLLRIGNRIWCFNRTGNTSGNVYSNYSDDSGVTWSTPVSQFPMISGPSAIRMQSGAIVIAGRTNTTGLALIYTSVDNGQTWYGSFLDDPGFDVVYATPVDLLDGSCMLAYASEAVAGTSDIVYSIARPASIDYTPWGSRGANITVPYRATANCATGGGAGLGAVGVTVGSAKVQFDITPVEGDTVFLAGVGKSTMALTAFPGAGADGWAIYGNNGDKYIEGSSSSFASAIAVGSTLSFVLDTDGSLRVYKNGSLLGGGAIVTGLTGTLYPAWGPGSSGAVSRSANLNTGAAAFPYPISGAVAWDPAYR